MEKTKKIAIDWNGPIQVAIVAAIILGANLPFFMMSRNDISEIRQEVTAIKDEIKDFHYRLLEIERNRKGN